ncbi:MAG: hypothetical protein RL717_1152 [Pseudomonadota bacterium]|jgi:hydrogenase/urease accessory protein HupE
MLPLRVLLLLALSASLWAPASDAQAHAGDATGFASVTIREAVVSYTLTPTPASQADPAQLPQLLHDKLSVTADGKRCVPADPKGLTAVFTCPAKPVQLTLRDDLADTLGAAHHVIALLTWEGGSASYSFAAQSRETHVTLASPAAAQSASSFFLLGVEHIATGYDHLLFLLALILCGGNLVQLLKIITAFTLAHSITLGAAALGLVHLPSALVEAVIALSIAYVAFENLFPRFAISRRWTISFLFGLMHGFGFSSVLQEIGLPRDNLVLALLNFNLGVEAGQLVAVAMVVPLLIRLRKTRWESMVVQMLSALVLLVGLGLFIERII